MLTGLPSTFAFQPAGPAGILLKTNQSGRTFFITCQPPEGKFCRIFSIFQKLSWMRKRRVCDAADI